MTQEAGERESERQIEVTCTHLNAVSVTMFREGNLQESEVSKGRCLRERPRCDLSVELLQASERQKERFASNLRFPFGKVRRNDKEEGKRRGERT
jgi:hypothetical protein